MKGKYIYFFIGTTAELIKLAPVIKEFKEQELDCKIITSGQTKVLFDEFIDFLGPVKANIAFKEKGNKSSILIFILWAIKTLFVGLLLLRKEFKGLNKKNAYFIVHGDTVSSLIGALIAKFYQFKIVHIESGLRSFHFLEPFPEELSRYIISRLADIHFCPNEWSINNLSGKKGVKINTFQNTLIESFWWALKSKRSPNSIKKIKNKYFVLVTHRQEHLIFWKKWTQNLLRFVLANIDRDLTCVFITHSLTLNFLKSTGFYSNLRRRKNLIFSPRLPYIDFMKLINNAEFLVTDGGSNQEEGYYMGKPCLILRRRTERIEGLGENVVLSKGDNETIKDFLSNYKKYQRKSVHFRIAPSRIIINYLVKH